MAKKETKSKPTAANPKSSKGDQVQTHYCPYTLKSKKRQTSKPNIKMNKPGYKRDPLLPTHNPKQNKRNIKTLYKYLKLTISNTYLNTC
jgi:hypothetical protein